MAEVRHNPVRPALRPAAMHRRPQSRQRGVALVVSLAAMLIVLSLVLVFARENQTYGLLARNRHAEAQARLMVEGAARVIASDLHRLVRSGGTLDDLTVPLEAGRIGDGLYWVLGVDFDEDRRHAFGLVSEAGKVNLNSAPTPWLARLPDMDESMAAAVVDWRDGDDEPSPNGAEAPYYLARTPPYLPANRAMETVEELLLLRDFDRTLLYGADRNLNDVLDPDENPLAPLRGLASYVTTFSIEPAEMPGVGPRFHVNQASFDELTSAMESSGLSASRRDSVAAAIIGNRPHNSVLNALMATDLTPAEAARIEPRLRAGPANAPARMGLLDVNHASASVLGAMPGLEPGDGDTLVQARGERSPNRQGMLWVVDVLGNDKALAIGPLITGRSYQFSADILAVSPDGRAFARRFVVIDVAPDRPVIRYHRDRTALGWPLDPSILESLRAGEGADSVARNLSVGGAG